MAEFQTPRAALLAIYEAYRSRDLDGVVACKDFQREALMALAELGAEKHMEIDEAIVAQMASTLEAAFRAEANTTGFPELDGVVMTFPEVEELEPGLVIVTEQWHHPDGSVSVGRVYVSRGRDGWRVLHPVAEPAA